MPSTLAAPPEPPTRANPAQRLRTEMAGVRLSFTWLGVRKTLSPEQKSRAAETFGAADEYVTASKKLLDTKHPAFKQVTAVRHRLVAAWKSRSLPFPEPGIRLIRRDDIESLDEQFQTLRVQLVEAVDELSSVYDELLTTARRQLGTLFRETDYPTSFVGMFDAAWDYPSCEPPSYLRALSPELYEQECQRVATRFEEAVRLAEEAFTTEFGELVFHLVDRLSGQDDGKPKIFRDSAVDNLREFFERFRHLNIGSNEELDQLVTDAQGLLRGVQPRRLRENEGLRSRLAEQLKQVGSALDDLLIERPRRQILRTPK